MKHQTIVTFVTILTFSCFFYASAAQAKLTLPEAQKIAVKAVSGGHVKSSEFEHEMNQDVYSFDIQTSDKAIHEILVNANTGKIVSNKIESKAEEAKEAAEDTEKD